MHFEIIAEGTEVKIIAISKYIEGEEQEIADIKAGNKKIKVSCYDGEYLGAYQVFGTEAELPEELGLAKYVSGWGVAVNEKLVKAVGEEFAMHKQLNSCSLQERQGHKNRKNSNQSQA